MGLDEAISDLLYRHDCVIVPGLGGFVARRVGAQLEDDRFHPPHKEISFNEALQSQDGLLTDYLARREGISFEAAAQRIRARVKDWKETLSNKRYIQLRGIGKLSSSAERALQFQPAQTVNYHAESFGLAPIQVQKRSPKPVGAAKGWHSALKYAAVWLLLIALCAFPIYHLSKQPGPTQRDQATLNPFAGVSMVTEAPHTKAKTRHEPPQLAVKTRPSRQAATKGTTRQPVQEQVAQPAREARVRIHQLIAGAFSVRRHAERLLAKLKRQGYKAQIAGEAGSLTLVAVASFNSKAAAMQAYYEIRKRLPEIWYRHAR